MNDPVFVMPAEVLQFICRGCGARLTVPAKLAGIEGPCPKCGVRIKAPDITSSASPPPPPAPSPAAAGQATAGPFAGGREPSARQPGSQAIIRPEPREPHTRAPRQAISPRHRTTDVAKKPEPRAERADPSAAWALGVGRLLIPVAFLLLGGGIAYFLLDSFASERSQAGPPVKPVQPASAGPQDRVEPHAIISTDTGAPVPDEDPDALAAQSLEAQDVLRDFLRASSVGARLLLIEPSLERAALEGSVIDTPLLTARRVTPGAPRRNTLENFVDHPFSVRFERDDAEPMDVLVVVRKRPEQKPKVLIEPLLDLLGGRLDAFAETPTDEPETFRVVMEPLPRCFEENIPNPDDKITYKLLADTQGGEIARAYASKYSPLAEILYTPDSALRWGRRLPATIVLKWNHDEARATGQGSGRPYVELIGIKSLDWSP